MRNNKKYLSALIAVPALGEDAEVEFDTLADFSPEQKEGEFSMPFGEEILVYEKEIDWDKTKFSDEENEIIRAFVNTGEVGRQLEQSYFNK